MLDCNIQGKKTLYVIIRYISKPYIMRTIVRQVIKCVKGDKTTKPYKGIPTSYWVWKKGDNNISVFNHRKTLKNYLIHPL